MRCAVRLISNVRSAAPSISTSSPNATRSNIFSTVCMTWLGSQRRDWSSTTKCLRLPWNDHQVAACTAQPQQEEDTFQGIEDWGSNACAEMGTFTDRIVR